MKRIVKSNGEIQPKIDRWVKQARLKKNTADWTHFSSDKGEDGIYTATKASLFEEQSGICCYCEQQIEERSCHIEHFQGKGKYPVRMFVYSNLHASCNGSPGTCNHCCGHKRAEHGNPDILVSPLDADCESRFRYTGRGEMKPAREDDQEAEDTISHLGLNGRRLRKIRYGLMIELESYCQGMTSSEFASHVHDKLQKDCDGRFPPFFTTIEQYAEELTA